ncbi:uncharacterized protein LOC119682345 [Teleopsis dalmanni]|uniref:uncharacterized protein LOC119682345 n=1 Tax=Teleopsis dalmanni TaxID=139649 RepID=UPI0018CEF777|nr:uncharacterized protein LOC119682345 [Teleopsis dalmanni]
MVLQSQNLSLNEGAPGTIVSEQMDHDLLERAPGPLPDKPEEMDIPLSQESAGMSISSEQERDLLEPGLTKKTQTRVKLSGAGRKRLKALLAKGIPLETARSLAVKPATATNEGQATPKRSRSDSSTPTSSSKPTKRIALQGKKVDNKSTVPATALPIFSRMKEVETSHGGKPGPSKEVATVSVGQAEHSTSSEDHCSKPTLAETVRSKKIGILPHNFPEGIWSNEEIGKVQKCILDKMYETCRAPGVKPHFAGYSLKPGWFTINCLDDETVTWSKETIPALKPWEGAQLKVVDEAEVPKSEIYVGYFPGSASWQSDRILGQIECQNSGMRVRDWRVLHRLNKGDIVEMAIALDPMSSEMVGKLGNKVFYGLSSAVLRPRHKGNRAKEVVEDERPTTSAACAQSSNQKPKTGLNSGGPPLRGGRIRAQGRKPSALSGRLRKWERKDPEAAELLRGTKGGKVRKGQSGI